MSYVMILEMILETVKRIPWVTIWMALRILKERKRNRSCKGEIIMDEIKREIDVDGDDNISFNEYKMYMLSVKNKEKKREATKAYVKDKIVDLVVIGIAIAATAFTGVVLI